MNTSRLTAGASRFAHLTGLSRKVRSVADDDQCDDDEPKGKRSRASDNDEDGEDDPKSKKSKRADDDQRDDDEPKCKRSRASDDDDDGEDEPKSKKSKRADDDQCDDDEPKGKRSRASDEDDDDEEDDDKEEMNGRSAKASARRREQARIGAILGHAAAANNLPLAVSLACETRMTRLEAITVLKGQGGRQRDDRDDAGANRHARQDRSSRNVQLGSDSHGPTGPQAVSRGWDAAFQRAGIKSTPR